jgi:hypothetical protein
MPNVRLGRIRRWAIIGTREDGSRPRQTRGRRSVGRYRSVAEGAIQPTQKCGVKRWVGGEAPVPVFRLVVSSPPPFEPDLRLVAASGSP